MTKISNKALKNGVQSTEYQSQHSNKMTLCLSDRAAKKIIENHN